VIGGNTSTLPVSQNLIEKLKIGFQNYLQICDKLTIPDFHFVEIGREINKKSLKHLVRCIKMIKFSLR